MFYIKIADLTVEMRAEYSWSKKFCKDYLAEPTAPHLIARASKEEIQAEMELGDFKYPPEYCENICLYRSIAEQLPKFNRFVIHGAAIAYGGHAYLFTAPSGTGKSTHVRLWSDLLGDKVTVINGDKPILRVEDGKTTVFSTPWAGKEGWQSNISSPLAAICLLSRDQNNSIKKIAPTDFFSEIIRQIYIPTEPDSRLKTFDLINSLASSTDFYYLGCNMEIDAAKVAFEAMVGKK